MSVHPSEDELVLQYYGEGDDGGAVEAHLGVCAGCAARRDALARVLGAVSDAETPEPGPDYGRRLWERLRPRVVKPRRPLARRLAPWLAAAACLLVAFFVGRASREHEVRLAQQPIPAPARERILLIAVGEHLERSQMVLVELENATGNGVVDISMERRMAEGLVPANRLYRQAAQRAGEPGVAGVLDELERVLVEVAMSPESLPRVELEEIRRRVEEQGILFKLRVIGSQVRERGRMVLPRVERES